MDAVRWDGAGEGLGGDGGGAQGGAAPAADGDVAADDETPSRFRRPRLPRAQRAMLGRRMMALTTRPSSADECKGTSPRPRETLLCLRLCPVL
eukprot:scaffold117252_cov48-Phaeocystis_antarctica.AAC.1